MCSTEELTPASVIAQAIVDIVTVGSQELREECLRASGSQNMYELSKTVENSLTSFFNQATMKHSCSPPGQTVVFMPRGNVSSCSILQRTYDESDLHDFSSADEEPLEFSTMIADDGFHTPPPAANHPNADPFSPALGLFSPRKAGASGNDDDFSQDECEPLEKQVEHHSQMRCPKNLHFSGFVANDLCSTVENHQLQAIYDHELSDFSD